MPDVEVKPIPYNDDAFEIRLDKSFLQLYVKNQDFTGERCKPDRGEVFYVEVDPDKRGKGVGSMLAVMALDLMKGEGTKTVVMSPVSKGGEAMIASLLRKGFISGPIKKGKTGKMEFLIS
jgi:ribosomal protein S18 acetylase RimI-like enzyme